MVKTYADLITEKNTKVPMIKMNGVSIETLKGLKIGDIRKLDKELKKSKGRII